MSEKIKRKRGQLGIALIAHDQMKSNLTSWVLRHREALQLHRLYATGTTGKQLMSHAAGMEIQTFASGPLGGDLQIGAKVVEGEIDVLFFFIDPLTPQPHDVDVKALVRVCMLAGIPMACNEATADIIVTSPFLRNSGCVNEGGVKRDMT